MADALAKQASGLELKERSFAELVAEKKPYYQKRIELFEQFKARQDAQVEAARAAAAPIQIVLPDGAVKAGVKGATTPLDVANEISKGLAKKVVVAKVDGASWDAFRPLEGDCALQLLSFDDADGKEVSQLVGAFCWAAGSNGGRPAARRRRLVTPLRFG